MKKKTLLIGALSTVASVTAGLLIKKKYDDNKVKDGSLKQKGNVMFTTSLVDLYDPYSDKDNMLSEEDMIKEFKKETSL